VNNRLKQLGYKADILFLQEYLNKDEAYSIEQKILKMVDLTNTGLLRSGNTETFTRYGPKTL